MSGNKQHLKSDKCRFISKDDDVSGCVS